VPAIGGVFAAACDQRWPNARASAIVSEGTLSFDPNSLLASMLVSSIGLVLLKYARTHRRLPHGVIGVVMLGYPYAVDDVVLMLALAPVLLVALWLATRLGL
jgi:hypothetical protein